MNRAPVASLIALLSLAAAPAPAITLQQAMADPDWIGPPVEQPYWGVDGRAIYYRIKENGSSIRDLHRIDGASGADTLVDPAAMANADGPDAVFDRNRRRAAFVRNGDVFIRDLANGRLTQVTRTPQAETQPQFSADGRAVQYRDHDQWFSYSIGGGTSGAAAIVEATEDPATKKPDDLGRLQLDLFSTLRDIKADRDAKTKHDDTFRKNDPTRAPLPFHLGDEVKIADTSLSPDAKWLLVVTVPKGYDAGRIGKLQHFVTESGYEEPEDERTRVGRNDPAPQTLWLLDLVAHQQHKLSFADLPGIDDDPLKAIRAENAKAAKAAGRKYGDDDGDDAQAEDGKSADHRHRKSHKHEAGSDRDLEVQGFAWSRDGAQVAVQLHSIDNKDRWIATVDFAHAKLASQHRLTDPAWINWNFNDFGWEYDDRTLWYLSEESGYSQLYAKTPGGRTTALTSGTFEVSQPALSPDGRWFYLRANAEAPTSYDAWRVAVGGGKLERVTALKGMERFFVSPDGTRLLVQYSSAYVPAQIGTIAADGSGALRPLTDTRTAEYKALSWPALDIVAVPSSHVDRPIQAKFYKPKDFDPAKKYPAVLFVHGAGYTQNTDHYWPYYFREQMFNDLLTEHGYVVLDMDYRASEGYGRDWRTAIYRDMGHPELEDLLDGKAWLVEHWSVDPQRVGVYGGSYGGFMALMALFRAPDDFAAGAALRPVTDWTQYNHGYTSKILNDPQVDPIAYRRSSPIEFADGFKGALLICHGMIDDNVLFADSVRLYQRLIELHKDNFEIAPFPMERHGFEHADSWLDEYKRVFKLFETNLK
ncbi:MAG TPA: LpqB family beta-propeller domain-containing protein [Rhodanobacteraceae bacterium]|nr:LpqB family beta-propeller domain-containing protein [Rhodanobacteraceae bacterium]